MRVILLVAVLVLVACFDLPTAFTDYIDERTVAEQVFFVDCSPLTYIISLATTGGCRALNADSTLLTGAIPRWISSCPACILVDESGFLTVGAVPRVGVTITACGPNGKCEKSQPLDSVP